MTDGEGIRRAFAFSFRLTASVRMDRLPVHRGFMTRWLESWLPRCSYIGTDGFHHFAARFGCDRVRTGRWDWERGTALDLGFEPRVGLRSFALDGFRRSPAVSDDPESLLVTLLLPPKITVNGA